MVCYCQGLESVLTNSSSKMNITVSEIDLETVGINITFESDDIDHRALFKAIDGRNGAFR